jgi:hypothetical protein
MAAAAELSAAQATASAVSPLLEIYDTQVMAVLTGQSALSAKLDAVLAELERVQANAPPAGDSELAAYARKVLDLRTRMDAVAYTMKRVHVRLESLQGAVGKHEASAASQRRKQAAANRANEAAAAAAAEAAAALHAAALAAGPEEPAAAAAEEAAPAAAE